MSVEVTRLPTGLTVVTDSMPHLQTASLGIWVGSSRHQRTLGPGERVALIGENGELPGAGGRLVVDVLAAVGAEQAHHIREPCESEIRQVHDSSRPMFADHRRR